MEQSVAMLGANKELARKLEREMNLRGHMLATHDEATAAALSTIRELMAPPEPEKKQQIGLMTDRD